MLRTEHFIRSEGLFREGEQIVVAVSGGPDSTALLHILSELANRWSLKLHVAHIDHGFRGEESRREAEWVRSLSEQLGWPCTIYNADIPAAVAASGGNPQEVAREIRYGYLLETVAECRADVLALGHHADDQAETVLMRILRGSSLTGITGMAPVAWRQGVKLVRPLLRIYKEEIFRYMHEHGYAYCTDSSNELPKYTRNRLRMDVMPRLKSFNPELIPSLIRMADILRDEDRLLHSLAESESSRVFRRSTYGYTGDREQMLLLDVALQRRVIKLILSYLCKNQGQVQAIHIEQVREAILRTDVPSITLHLPGVTFIREYDELRLTISQPEHTARSYEYVVEQENSCVLIAEADASLRLSTHEEVSAISPDTCDGFGVSCAYFDIDHLTFPLTIRNRRPGDRIQLMNMQGTKKLKELFIDLKVPPSRRDTVPLVFDAAGRLLWACGIRRSGHALIQDRTKKVLRIQFEQNDSMYSNID